MASPTTRFPLGVYAGNPNGNDPASEAAFEAQFASFKNTMGAAPQFMNAFTDFTQDPTQWVSNASWTAWSWAQSPVARSLTPVIGVPMAANTSWGNQDQFFKAIIAGQYDAIYKGIVDAWAGQGFKTFYLRIGYEMNVSSYNPWYMGDRPAVTADWVAAFQHLSTLMKAEGARDGANVQIVWNPVAVNQSSQPITNAYPGDQYVDVIGTDIYSPVAPLSLDDWAANNGTSDATVAQWATNPLNLEHFWNYPSANKANPAGQPGVGWSVQDAINLAKAHGKPVAIAETGAGSNGPNYGPADDPAFPAWLASELAQPGAPQVAFVNIWDAQLGDGNWDFSSSGATKPQEAAAWAAYFGATSSATTSPQPLVLQVPGATGSDKVVIGAGDPNSLLSFADTNGDQLTMPATTGGAENWYAGQTGLNDNVYQWLDSAGAVHVWTPTWGLVNTVRVGDTTGRSFHLADFVEADARLSGASTTPGQASSLTIDAAKRGTIALGSGNYDVNFTALSQSGGASYNTVRLTEGSGNDTFVLTGSWGVTQAMVTAGAGTDRMTFLDTGAVQVQAGSGNDTVIGGNGGNSITAGTGTVDVTGGTGADRFIFHAGDGLMILENFSTAKGDFIGLDAVLQPSLRETPTASGVMLSFGTDPSSGVLVKGAASVPASALHWI